MAGEIVGRVLLRAVASVLVALCAPLAAAAQERTAADDRMIVTLLGSGGGPEPILRRFGPATLVQAGGRNFLFDAGRGVTVRLYQLGISSGKIDAVFLTHYHSDHVAGLPDLWMTGYMFGPFGSRSAPLRLWGPSSGTPDVAGVARLAKGLGEAFSDDVTTRQADEHVSALATRIEAHGFTPDNGVVFDEAGVRVSAFAVNHGDLIKPSVGYRVDYNSRSVTISGDTKFDENLIRAASGTDLLVHEVFAMSGRLAKLPQLKPVADHHTSPEEAGEVFSRAKPKLAAFSHIVLLETSVDELLARTRSTYAGALEVGEDLMRFEIGTTVTVKKWNQDRRGYME